MNVFVAKYNDGEHARVFQAKIKANFQHIIIDVYDNEDFIKEIVYWQHSDIQKDEFAEGVLKLNFTKLNGKVASLETDLTFVDELKRVCPDVAYIGGFYTKLFSIPQKIIVVLTVSLIAFFVLAWSTILPIAINTIVSFVPIKKEIEMGDKYFSQITEMSNFKIDTLKSNQLTLFYKELHVKSPYPVKIWFVDNEVVNAFALPGGNIVVFNGLLKKLNKSEQLVALLGHEYGHVAKRHSMQQMIGQMGISALLSLFSGTDTFTSTVLKQVGNIGELAQTREKEAESDEFAFQLMKEEHLNPQGIIDLFDKLNEDKEVKKVSGYMPSFLLTHPKIEERVKVTKLKIKHETYTFQSNVKLDSIFNEIKTIAE